MFPYQLNHQYSLLTSSSSTTNNWNQSNLQSNSQNSLMSGNANMNFQFPVAQNPLQMILVNNPPMWNQFRQFLQQQNINIASQTDNSFAKTFWNLQQAKLAEGQNSISRFIEHPQPPSFGSSSQNEQCFYFADRKFYDIQTYLEFVEEYEAVKSDLRSLPNYSDLNYLNVPPESSMEQYQLLHGFKFAIPQKIRQFEKAQYMTSSNYDEIKIELENNGTDADWTVEERTLKGDMMTLMDSPKFPPSQLPLTSNLSLIWEMSSDVNPMQLANYNSVASYSPNSTKSSQESLKKNTPKRSKKPLEDHCVFCKNNGADEKIYKNHLLKDIDGKTTCPRLRMYKCPTCGAKGDRAHTLNYCPEKKIITMRDVAKKLRHKQPLSQFR